LRRVLIQIGAAAAVVVALVSVAGVLVARHSAENEAVHDAASLADVLAGSVLQPALTAANGRDPSTLPATVNTIVRQRILSPTVVRVKLWTPDGLIAYSDEPRLIGQRFALDDEARDVLANPRVRAEVSDLSHPENVYERSQGRLLEVYRPVWTPTGQPLLFEIYLKYNVVTERTGQLWRGFAGIMLSSVLAIFALLLPLIWALLARARRAQQQREEAMQAALAASDEERRRIASNLHDGVVQQLAGASFEVSAGAEQARAAGANALAGRLDDTAAKVRTGIGGLRSLLVDIYPASLNDAGLADALRELARSLPATAPELELAIDDEAARALTDAEQQAFFRIAQEALRNAVRHSGAGGVSLVLHRNADRVVMEIADDGRGLPDPEAVASPPGHFGLALMSDAAARVGAALQLAATPPGTRWRVVVTP
jgi:signal transduction histidine kinase